MARDGPSDATTHTGTRATDPVDLPASSPSAMHDAAASPSARSASKRPAAKPRVELDQVDVSLLEAVLCFWQPQRTFTRWNSVRETMLRKGWTQFNSISVCRVRLVEVLQRAKKLGHDVSWSTNVTLHKVLTAICKVAQRRLVLLKKKKKEKEKETVAIVAADPELQTKTRPTPVPPSQSCSPSPAPTKEDAPAVVPAAKNSDGGATERSHPLCIEARNGEPLHPSQIPVTRLAGIPQKRRATTNEESGEAPTKNVHLSSSPRVSNVTSSSTLSDAPCPVTRTPTPSPATAGQARASSKRADFQSITEPSDTTDSSASNADCSMAPPPIDTLVDAAPAAMGISDSTEFELPQVDVVSSDWSPHATSSDTCSESPTLYSSRSDTIAPPRRAKKRRLINSPPAASDESMLAHVLGSLITIHDARAVNAREERELQQQYLAFQRRKLLDRMRRLQKA